MSKPKRWRLIADPDAQRDVGKFDTPIPSRRYLMQWLDEVGKPMSVPSITRMGWAFETNSPGMVLNDACVRWSATANWSAIEAVLTE